jgi:heat shock protein HslJ
MTSSNQAIAVGSTILLAAGLMTHSAYSQTTPPSQLMAGTWEWIGFRTPVEQLVVDAAERYTIQFEGSGRVLVRADCNRGNGAYIIGEDRQLTLGPIALTRAACPPGSLSDRFVRELARANRFFIKDKDLFLELPADSGTLRFRPRAQ